MSLVDALLLEPYRDPREVYIALRTDGLKGSGTIDDPYDGSRKSFSSISITNLRACMRSHDMRGIRPNGGA